MNATKGQPERHEKHVDVCGSVLSVYWDGNAWVSPCNGKQHPSHERAMRAELMRFLLDCGETDEDAEDKIDR